MKKMVLLGIIKINEIYLFIYNLCPSNKKKILDESQNGPVAYLNIKLFNVNMIYVCLFGH